MKICSFFLCTKIGWLICLAGLVGACKSTRVTLPVTTLRDALPPLPSSELGIPIQVYIKPWLQEIEKMTPTTFTSTDWPNYVPVGCDFRYKYRFVRSGLQVQLNQNRIRIVMNGQYQVAGSKTVCAFGKQVSPWVNGSCGFGAEPMRSVRIEIGSQLKLLPQYALQSVTRAEKVQAIDKCSMTVLEVDLTQTILDSMRAAVNSFGAELDASIAKLDLRAYQQVLTTQLTQKQALKGYGYLDIRPAGIALSPFQIKGDSLYTTLGFAAYPEISSVSQASPLAPAMPPLSVKAVNPGFSLHANARYDFKSLDTLINKTVGNRSFLVEGRQIIIQQVDMEGLSKHRVSLKVRFDGFASGDLFFTGTPVLDSAQQRLYIPDLEFDVRSPNVLLKIGNAVLARQILQKIRSMATISITDLYLRQQSALNATLNRTLRPGVQLVGQTSGLRLEAMVVQEHQILCQFSLYGQLAVRVGELKGLW